VCVILVIMIIDSHCHIHDSHFFPENQEAVYSRARQAGTDMIVVATSESDAEAAIAFADSHEGVWAVAGVHPHDTKEGWQRVEALLKQKPSALVGIGEIGLDYFYDNSPRDVQIRALEEQLQWAVDYDLPVSFHVREAYDDFWPLFDNFRGIRGVLHCFTDTASTLEKALERGLYIGVNGISTFTKDASQQALFASLPLEKMLLETDAPFLTPKPFRGKINEPVYVVEVARHQAEVRNLPLDDILSQTTANTRNLFAL
jgi:TatD DNase family protein